MSKIVLDDKKLLIVKDLYTYFYTSNGVVPAVDGVSFSIKKGEILGLVGESGCGKSVTALSIMRLIPQPPGKILSGKIEFAGENLLDKKESEIREIRGNEISMVFQEPMTSFNPVFTIGFQIMESLILHQKLTKAQAREKAIDMLRTVGIPSPEKRVDDYPHEFSGGMLQRAMIAMALACNPKLLIADEPTTSLDVTIQAQIIDVLQDLRNNFKIAILYITHNLAVIAELADVVAVMYSGKIVEMADVYTLFSHPLHPYTIGLLDSIPKEGNKRKRLTAIKGVVPDPRFMPTGCRFHPRCPYANGICRQKEPPLVDKGNAHFVACRKKF